jgi:hypothetical protein
MEEKFQNGMMIAVLFFKNKSDIPKERVRFKGKQDDM